MAAKKICNFDKYGFCKSKDSCKDYHPVEICKKQVCNIEGCDKRHPQKCRYFRSGYCRFQDSCKYEHKEYVNTNELLERIHELEKEKAVQAERIHELEKGGKVQAERIDKLEKDKKVQVLMFACKLFSHKLT